MNAQIGSSLRRLTLLAVLLSAPLAVPAGTDVPPGTVAPAFELASMKGGKDGLAQYKGQVVMLNFWATWCGPCRGEMPKLEAIYKRYKARGFTMLGVNVEPDSASATKWLEQTPVTFPILFDTDSKVSKLYAVSGMPSTVLVDKHGQVRWVHRSYRAGDENEYLDQIGKLLRE